MFFKKRLSEKEKMEKQLKEAKAYFAFQSYHTVIRLAKNYTKNETPKDKVLILNYFIDSLLDDICTSTGIIYFFEHPYGISSDPFPLLYYDESSKIYEVRTKRKVPVNLKKSRVYAHPFRPESTVKFLKFFQHKKFVYSDDNHSSKYYPEINLCYVHNGNHSAHINKYLNKECTVFSEEYDLRKLFPHCTTDGVKWYSSHTGEHLFAGFALKSGEPLFYNVTEFRLAAVYTLAQMRYFIRKGQNYE